jgi:hypothetical protein
MGVDSMGRLMVMGGMDTNGNDVTDVWRSQQLGAPDIAPAFVSYPSLSAAYLAPYVSSIGATGNPQPAFLVVSGPAGMQVDQYSGAITWTPQANQVGSISVTIRATNFAGFADRTFSITVPNPPPAIPANLTVAGVTGNSVTLSWDPESPVVGPVTYTVSLRHSVHSPRGSGGSVWYTPIGSVSNLTRITLTGLAPGQSQTYYVAATGSGGTSGYAGIFVTIPVPAVPRLSSAVLAVAGGFQFTVLTSVAQTTLVQATSNLADSTSWVTIATNPPGNAFTFTDTNAAQYPARFYRVLAP